MTESPSSRPTGGDASAPREPARPSRDAGHRSPHAQAALRISFWAVFATQLGLGLRLAAVNQSPGTFDSRQNLVVARAVAEAIALLQYSPPIGKKMRQLENNGRNSRVFT